MANTQSVFLAGADVDPEGRVDYGDRPTFDGATKFTINFVVKHGQLADLIRAAENFSREDPTSYETCRYFFDMVHVATDSGKLWGAAAAALVAAILFWPRRTGVGVWEITLADADFTIQIKRRTVG